MKKHLKLTGCALAALALITGSANAGEKGFKKIFNGKDLSGWKGNTDLWSVLDGAITGVTKAEPKLTHNTFLVWQEGKLANFELRLQYRIVKGNSGIQYRSHLKDQGDFGPIVSGYQADFEAGTKYSGILYEEKGRGILALRGEKVVIDGLEEKEIKRGKKTIKRQVPNKKVTGSLGDTVEMQKKIKSEQWNDYRIVANGNHLQHFINGMQTVDVTDKGPGNAKSGILALQIHVGPPMTVQFKDIRLKKLK
jgi:hypothetical protein